MVSTTGARVRARPRVFYGWWIVLVAVLLNVYQGGVLFYGFTLLLTPIIEETGWSRTQITIVFPIMGLLGAGLAPFLGFAFDRVGPRPILALGLLFMGAGLIAMGSARSLPAFYVAFITANMGSAGIWMATGSAVPNWFVRWRGRALGAYSMGFALAGALALPFLWLIDTVSWRGAVALAGLVTWTLVPVAVWVIRHRPERYGLWPDGAEGPPTRGDPAGAAAEVNIRARQALKMRAFWLLAIGSSMGSLTISAIEVHEAPFMESVGFTRRDAALFLTAFPLSTIVGRITFGILADLWDSRRATVLALGLQALAVVTLAFFDISRVWLIPLFLVLWGLGWGGTVVTRPALQADLFGRYSFGTIQGLLSTTGEWGFALAPLAASLSIDVLGSYRPVFLLFAGLTLLATPMILAIRRPAPQHARR